VLRTQPTFSINVEVEIDYGQVYIYAVPPWANDGKQGYDAMTEALNDAWQSHRYVGLADGLIDLVTPVQWNFHAPMRIEVWPAEPPADDDNWDHVVDVDLDVPYGQLCFQASGGRPAIVCEERVPSGTYRVRVSGRGYTAAKAGAEGLDAYRLRLWSRSGNSRPVLRKSWPGWQHAE